MAISLQKGQNIALTKDNPGLNKIQVGLGWDPQETGDSFDLDASCFMLGSNGKLLSDRHFVFFNNLESSDGSVVHTGDNLTGEGEGDDEVIEITLNKVSPDVQRLVITVSIFEAGKKHQNFGMVENSFVRIVDASTGTELARYDLREDFSIETDLIFAELYRHDGEWKFRALGQGSTGEIDELVKKFQQNI